VHTAGGRHSAWSGEGKRADAVDLVVDSEKRAGQYTGAPACGCTLIDRARLQVGNGGEKKGSGGWGAWEKVSSYDMRLCLEVSSYDVRLSLVNLQLVGLYYSRFVILAS
jgi:hypothetical protein